jgi:hypothetical protein
MRGMSGMTTEQMPTMASRLPAGAMLGATALDLVLAVGVALVLRHRRLPQDVSRASASPVEESAHQDRPWSFLLGVLVGAAVVAVVTADSLAATPIGAGGMTGMGH